MSIAKKREKWCNIDIATKFTTFWKVLKQVDDKVF